MKFVKNTTKIKLLTQYEYCIINSVLFYDMIFIARVSLCLFILFRLLFLLVNIGKFIYLFCPHIYRTLNVFVSVPNLITDCVAYAINFSNCLNVSHFHILIHRIHVIGNNSDHYCHGQRSCMAML